MSMDKLAPEWVREHAPSYCHDALYYMRSEIAAPLTTLVDGQPHTIATNGHVLLDLPFDYGFAPSPKEPSNLHNVMRALPTSEGIPLNLDALRDFLGLTVVKCADCEDSGLVECDECDGDGGIECSCHCGDEHTRDCNECDGKGKLACMTCRANAREKVVKIGALAFNRSVLAKAVRHLPFTMALWHAADSDMRASMISGEWGHILVMPVRGDAVSKTSPTFPLEATHVA